MKELSVSYIPLKPPAGTEAKGLVPEVLASCLARYSRSNDGIEVIIEKFSDKSPEAIFKFVDYGHASIAGLTGAIAIAIDNISMILALKLFEASPMADGQESSTRYIAMKDSPNTYLEPSEAGIPSDCEELYKNCLNKGLKLYQKTSEGLEGKVALNPDIARVPDGTPAKVAQRMLKNYALDRTRYFLPASCKTNMALVMSARMWAEVLRQLDSLPWKEAKQLCPLLRQELQKAAPNLVRHSYADQASSAQTQLLLEGWSNQTNNTLARYDEIDKHQRVGLTPTLGMPQQDAPTIQVWQPQPPNWEDGDYDQALEDAFKGKYNRYSMVGPWIKRLTVCSQWPAMALAEIRDLNRHRTGYRLTHLVPQGFYIPEETQNIISELDLKKELKSFLDDYKALLTKLNACTAPPDANAGATSSYPYGFFLGTQLPFEHTQQGDKFVYEVELRTGLGAHFKYAQHLADAATKVTEIIPKLKKHIQIGTAEPE